jgi:TRAP-type C4-dicarboxylate transport system permease small subunit
MFIWNTFLGVPVGLDRGLHASFDLLSKRLCGRKKIKYQLLVLMMSAFLFGVFIYVGIPYAFSNINQRTPALLIPYTFVILAIPIGGIVGFIYVIKNILALALLKKEG